MLVRAVKNFDVKITSRLARKGSPEVLDELNVKLAYALAHVRYSIDDKRAPAQINNRASQRFIHRDVCRAESHYAALVAERVSECLPNCDGNVFD
jgi:hypothetical protein